MRWSTVLRPVRRSTKTNCIATAVYFEARGETLEGQLAVARVVMNRAASGSYPAELVRVVKQPAQFSFVRHGAVPGGRHRFGRVGAGPGHRRLAMANVVPSLEHRRLVVPRRLCRAVMGPPAHMVQKIGAHIFYRA